MYSLPENPETPSRSATLETEKSQLLEAEASLKPTLNVLKDSLTARKPSDELKQSRHRRSRMAKFAP